MNTTSLTPFLFGITLHFAAQLRAQDATEARPAGRTPSAVRRFFQNPIDYWQRGLGFEEAGKDEAKNASQQQGKVDQTGRASDWGQVITLPDGSLATKELPKQLVAVLEDPTPNHIRAYFEWRLARTQKILRAAELMKEFRSGGSANAGEAGPEPARALPTKDPREAPPPAASSAPLGRGTEDRDAPFTVRYFHKQGCPHCDSQDLILAEWLRENPSGKLEVVEFGSSPELWRAYQVRGTPSLAVEGRGGRKPVFLEGLSRKEALDRALAETRSTAASDLSGKGEKRQ